MGRSTGELVGKNPTNPAETMVLFYGRRPIYSNFYILTFKSGGRQFNCTEQYFQYKKAIFFGDEKTAARIMKTASPGQQKKLGRQVKGYNENRWEQVRAKVMEEGCLAKFIQNSHAKEKLLSTGDSRLVECSPTDRVWGIGISLMDPRALNHKKWRGQNLLGKQLEKVRELITKNGC